MAERAKKKVSGGFKLTESERQASDYKAANFNSSQEVPPEGYRYAEEVPSPEIDNLVAEDAPKQRYEGQQVEPKITDLSPDSLTLANLSLGSANAFVVMMFGSECGLYDGEKKLLYPSLARVINRLPAASAARASVFVDPIVLLLGLGIWANRIISIKSKQRAEANAVTAREFAAASGISWDGTRQANSQPGANVEPSGQVRNGTEAVPPETRVDPGYANGSIGQIPDAISQSRDTNINGDN